MTRGADLRYDLTLTFEEAAFGTETTLRIPRLETCPKCTGSGSANGARPPSAPACGGRGQVRFTQGFFTVARTCPQCQGEGRVISDPCTECHGEGRVERERSIIGQDPRRGGHRRAPAPLRRGGARPPGRPGGRPLRRPPGAPAQALPPRRLDRAVAHDDQLPAGGARHHGRGGHAPRQDAARHPCRHRTTAATSACAARASTGSTAAAGGTTW